MRHRALPFATPPYSLTSDPLPGPSRPRAQTPPLMSPNLSSASLTQSTTSSMASIVEPPKFTPVGPPSRVPGFHMGIPSTTSGMLPPSSVPPPLPRRFSMETSGPPVHLQHNHPLPVQQEASPATSQEIYFPSTLSEPGRHGQPLHGSSPSTSSQSTYEKYIKRPPVIHRRLGTSGETFCFPKPRIYRVVWPYVPQNMDEIQLDYGDLITVTSQCTDGWFTGRSTITGKFGTFPGNYVEPT